MRHTLLYVPFQNAIFLFFFLARHILPNQSHTHAHLPTDQSLPFLNPTSSTQLPPARGTRKGREGHRRRIVLLWPRGRRRYPHVILERYHHRSRTRTSYPLSFPPLPIYNLKKKHPKTKTTKNTPISPLLSIPSITTHARPHIAHDNMENSKRKKKTKKIK